MFEEFKKNLNICSTCPSLCQSVCPVFIQEGNKTHSPWGLMQLANLVMHNKIPFDDSVAKQMYHCIECKACTEQCEHKIDVSQVVQKAKFHAIRNEIAPKPINSFIERFHKHNNPFSKDLMQKLKKRLPARHFNNNTSVVYFAPCTSIAKSPEIISDTFELFDKLKIDFVSIYSDPIHCCGFPLLSCGAEYEFVDLAEINYQSLKKYKTIITSCPSCAHTLKHIYRKYDFHLENQIVTINEFLNPYLRDINYKLKKRIRSKIIYHDPCYLARHMNETKIARGLISQVTGYQPAEFYDNKEQCSSCGQGNAYPIIAKDTANQITQQRLTEVTEKKCNTLITNCPICTYKMREQSKNITIKDLVSYLNDSIEGTIE